MLDVASPGSRLPTRTVLLITDDGVVRDLLALSFRHAGFFAMSAASIASAQHLAAQVRPDLVVLDADLPDGMAGPQPCAQRAPGSPQPAAVLHGVPWILLTGPHAQTTTNLAEDDRALLTVPKPFVPRALVAQVLKALRQQALRANQPRQTRARSTLADRPMQVGGLRLDPGRQSLTLHGGQAGKHDLSLAPVEIRLLRCLMEHAGQVLSRQEIISLVWASDLSVDPRTVDQNVKRLRRTLQKAGAAHLVRTVHGVGYRLSLPTLELPIALATPVGAGDAPV